MRHRLLPLAPIAHASPPDPAWIGGFYDNGVVIVVIAACGMEVRLTLPTLVVPKPLEIVGGAVLLAMPGVLSRALLHALVGRAPPTA